MKKILIILIMLITISLMAEEIKTPPVNPEKWWTKLSDEEQWIYFREMSILYSSARKIAIENNESNNELITQLEKNKLFLKAYKPFYPKWGLGINSSIILDSQKQLDVTLNPGFYLFFLKGRLFLSTGLIFKVYQDVGGGISLGFGFLMN